jgi:methyltransferase-like protein 6
MNVADITTMLFCLSAIDPDDMPTAAATAAASLKPGGVLCFRDYGRYDEAQMKLGTSRSKLVKDNFYRKSDGTKCYYFSLEDLERLFVKHAGLETVDIKTLRRAYPNKATGRERRRVWVQGRFRKPMKAQR